MEAALQHWQQSTGKGVESGIMAYMAPHKPGSAEHSKCVDSLAKMVAMENLPFHIGERPGFVKFMRAVSPRFPRIPVSTLTRRLVQLAKDSRWRLGGELASIQCEINNA